MRGPDALRVHLLGGLEVEDVPVMALGSRKGRAVLRRLAVAAGGVVPADDLLDVAWPEGPPVRAADQLSVLVSRLRSALGTERVVRRDSGYALLTDWLDLAELDAAPARVSAALTNDPKVALALGRGALQLARGELLPEESGDAPWLDEARTSCRRALDQLRLLTAEAALAAGSARDSADLARACLDADPYDERALRLLMRACVETGQISSALAAYQAVSERLADELGVDPSPETRAVHVELLRRTTDQPEATPLPPPVAGREGMVTALGGRLHEAAGGHPGLVVVAGPAGMGKTTLLDELAARVERTAEVVRVAGSDVDGLPLQPLLDALTLFLSRRSDADDLLGPDAAVLDSLLGTPTIGAPTAASQALVSGTDRATLTSALVGLLRRIAGERPLLMLVDDAHLLDAPSSQLLAHLTRPASRLPLLVVAAVRPGQGPDLRPESVHDLTPLTRDDAARLVGEDQADALWARSGGNPLFLVELARWEGALPDSVLTAVAQRCTRSDELGDVLRAAAVLGSEVDVDLLAGVLGTPVGGLLDRLDGAVSQLLLRTTPQGYAFAHDLYREAFASLVTPARERVLHRDAAQLLARRTDTDPGRLGQHALAGGDDALAAGALAAAATVASARYEHERALALLDRAVALVPTPARRLQRARVLLLLGRYDEADREAQAADTDETRAAAQEMRALVAYLRRDVDEALALATAAAEATTDPEQAAGCLALAARIHLGRGNLDQAESAVREAVALATGPMRAIAAVWLALVISARGDAPQAYAIATSAEAVAARSEPLVEPHRHLALGRSLALMGRGAEAIAVFDQLADIVEQQHVRRFAGRAENFRGWVLRNLGASAEALDATQAAWEAVQTLDEVSGAEARGHAILDLADDALRSGDLATAQQWLDRATRAELAPHVMKWRFDLRRDLTLGRFALATHDATTALEHAEQVRVRATELGIRRFTVQADVLTARARHQYGDPVDLDVLAATASELITVAPLESWWLLVDLSRELGQPHFARQATDQVDGLLVGAGPWADELRRAARTALEGLPA